MKEPTRVILADDHPIFRVGLVRAIDVKRHNRADPGETDAALRKRVTPAELVILKLVSENLTSREIADRLFISVRTVENHRAHICFKLGLKGPHALLQYALENKAIL